MILILKVQSKHLQLYILFHFSKSQIMKAIDLLMLLVKESTNLEMVGSILVPEEDYHDYLTQMFGQGTHVISGMIRPGNKYLYAYGEELDAVYDVLIKNDDKQCIALALVR